MVAFAAFFACIFYLDWAGGEVGEALADALRFLFGAVAYAAPVALLAAGAVLIMRPALPSIHPFKTGALCLAAALTLGFAAGSLGLGPGETPRDGFLDSAYLERHGGSLRRVALLGLERAVLGRRLAHPVRVPADRRGAAVDGRLDREPRERHAGARHGHRRPHAAHRQHAQPADRRVAADHGAAQPRTGCRVARAAPSPRTASRSCAPRTWRRRRSTGRTATPTSTRRRTRTTRSSRRSPSRSTWPSSSRRRPRTADRTSPS